MRKVASTIVCASQAALLIISMAYPSAQAADLSDERPQHWNYYKEDEPMGGKTYMAQIASLNQVSFSFPYQGRQHAVLTLRTHPQYGKGVILSLQKGQFLCSSYDGCKVAVRFDEGKTSHYSATGAADHSADTIFIDNYERFVSHMLKAGMLRISATVYHEGSPVFEFNIADFDKEAYIPSTGRSGAERGSENLLNACLKEAHDDYIESRKESCSSAGSSLGDGSCNLSTHASALLEKYYKQDQELCAKRFKS